MPRQEAKLYKHDVFCKKIRQAIKTFSDNGQLCDFIIHVEGKSFKTHKLVLASCSQYFRAMLFNDTLESRENKVSLHDIGSETMSTILDFCYTSEIRIDPSNVQEILIAASFLQVDEIKAICMEHIKSRIDVQNCSSILELAARYNLTGLYESVSRFFIDNFRGIVDGDDFTELNEVEFIKMISSNELNVDNERQVFDAVLKWISATDSDGNSRISKLDDIMAHVRFPLMDTLSLAYISCNPLIKSSEACRRYLDLAKNYRLLESHRWSEDDKTYYDLVMPTNVELRRPTVRYIFAIGGWSKEAKALFSVEMYEPFSDKWVESGYTSIPRCGVGVTVLNNFIYAVGGHSGAYHLSSVERYDVIKGVWCTDVADLLEPRTSVGVVTLDDYIYAIGGESNSIIIPTMERYNPKTNSWKMCEPMEQKRLGAGVTVLNGLIYVIGGAENSGSILKSVECYDPRTKIWSFKRSMPAKRKHISCASHGGKIYAVGGVGEFGDELDTAECYDPELDKWESIPKMSDKRSGAAMVACDGLLYVVGGHNGHAKLDLVEAYDPIKSEWMLKQPMLHERLGCGLAVVTLGGGAPGPNATLCSSSATSASISNIRSRLTKEKDISFTHPYAP